MGRLSSPPPKTIGSLLAKYSGTIKYDETLGEYISIPAAMTLKKAKSLQSDIDRVLNPPLWEENDLVPPITRTI